MEASNDHISLTLSGAGMNDEEAQKGPGNHHTKHRLPTSLPISTASRKSLRRSWNQLPRCQRNLIILGIASGCLMLLLLLRDDQLIDVNGTKFAMRGILPFRNSPGEGRDNTNELPDTKGNERSSDNMAAAVIQQPHLPAAVPLQADQQQAGQSEVENAVREPDLKSSQQDDNNDYGIQNNKETLGKDNQKINVPEISLNNHLEAPPNSAHKPNSAHNPPLAHNLPSVHNPLSAPGRLKAPQPLIVPEENGNELSKTYQANTVEEANTIDVAILNPMKLPSHNDMTIEEFVNSIGTPKDAQPQHFHGANNERQEAVVRAFKHSWQAYKKYAWGHDNLKPISLGAHDWFGLGLTIIDSLDTMYIMGLDDEFKEGRDWVSENLKFDVNRDVNLFEVTIRVLGGLLSAYHLSGDKMFLSKSIELGNRLLPSFLTPSGIPYSDVNLSAMRAHAPKWSPDSSTSEVTTIQLEFRDLSKSTNISIYEEVSHNVNMKIHALEKNHGLVPIFINANTGTFRSYSTVSLGARGDSYYEYLLKQWLQTGCKKNDFLIADYMRAIDGVLTQLMRRTPKSHHVYIGELINGKEFKPKMDHLTCYLPGTLLLGHKLGMPDSHQMLANDLLETCYQTYMQQPTHLAPEISYFAISANEEHEIYVKSNDAHNLLRPEFVESLYYFYAITGNRTYQEMGWNIFQAFEKHTKVAAGYSSINNVKNIFNTKLRDMMETFWLGETLKYFYLLFSDNPKEIDLDNWVFNSEAHLLPIRNR